ncbi:unnamed protein product [Calypogeia fissa]
MEEDDMGGEAEDLTWINVNGNDYRSATIAVSSGADNMALCLLAARWKRRSSSLELGAVDKYEGLVGFVVDHGLRSSSAEEALWVQKWVSNLGEHLSPRSHNPLHCSALLH